MNHSRLEPDLLHYNLFSLSSRTCHNFYPIKYIPFSLLITNTVFVLNQYQSYQVQNRFISKEMNLSPGLIPICIWAVPSECHSNLTPPQECCLVNHFSPLCIPHGIYMYFPNKLEKSKYFFNKTDFSWHQFFKEYIFFFNFGGYFKKQQTLSKIWLLSWQNLYCMFVPLFESHLEMLLDI